MGFTICILSNIYSFSFTISSENTSAIMQPPPPTYQETEYTSQTVYDPYGAKQAPTAPVVITISPTLITSKEPTVYTCNNCRNHVTTTVDRSVDMVGWFCCLLGIGLFSFCFDGAYKF